MITNQTVTTTVSSDEYRQKARRRQQINRGLTYALAIVLAIWILLPIFLIFTMAFTTGGDDGIRAFPKSVFPLMPFSSETMEFFLDYEGIIDSFGNSVIIAVATLVLSTIIAAPAGYATSRYIFPGRDAFRLAILSVRAFPIVVLSIPLAILFVDLGIFDKPYTLALMHTALTLPTTVLVIGSVFASIPYELEEAAMIFGCTPIQAFRRVVLPLVLPGIAASAIFTFVMSWNEVFAAAILTRENRTLPAEVLYAIDTGAPPEFKFAGAFFMMIPSLVFIFFIRRYLFNMWGQITK